jgi:hypothetical protein
MTTARAGRGGLYWQSATQTAMIAVGALALVILHKLSRVAGGPYVPGEAFAYVQVALLVVFAFAGSRAAPLLLQGDPLGARYMVITTALALVTATFLQFVEGAHALRPMMTSFASTGFALGFVFIGAVGVQTWVGGRILIFGYWAAWVCGVGGLLLICLGHGAEATGTWLGDKSYPAVADAGRACWLLASLVVITVLRPFRLSKSAARDWVGNLDVNVRRDARNGDLTKLGVRVMPKVNRLLGWGRQHIDLLAAAAHLAWATQLLADPVIRSQASWLPVGLMLNALALPVEHASEWVWARTSTPSRPRR